MNLDARSVLSATFMRARFASETLPAAVVVARTITEIVDATSRYDIDPAPHDLSTFDPRELVGAPDPVHLTDRRVFDVIRYAVDDLQRVEGLTIRNLGYAFHSLPELHEPFDRNLYAFSLRFVAFHWAVLSTELKLALSRLVDEQPADLEARVTAPGFARSMY